MSIPIRSASEIAAKFIAVTPGRAAEYARGVSDPNVDWENPARAAEAAYEAGVQEAIARKAFASGIARAGNDKWRKGASEKGVTRWPEGVRGARDAYERGFAPFRETIAGLTLPPRGPAGAPGNLERVSIVANALHAKKLSM